MILTASTLDHPNASRPGDSLRYTLTAVHRMTLSRMANIRGYVTRTEILGKLCEYFECKIEDPARHIPTDEVPEAKSSETPSAKR